MCNCTQFKSELELKMESIDAVILYGSPRNNGNSTTIAKKVKQGIISKNRIVKDFYLHKMNIKPCSACEKCKKDINTLCVIKDDMQKIYQPVIYAKTLVIASPVYCFTFSAQIKLFIDRCYSLWGPKDHLLMNKNIIIILTYGDKDLFSSGGVNAIRTYQDAYNYYGCKITDILHCSAGKIGDVNKNQNILDKAYNLGLNIGTNI